MWHANRPKTAEHYSIVGQRVTPSQKQLQEAVDSASSTCSPYRVMSCGSPSMFQGKEAPSDWMMAEVLDSPSSSLSSSDQPMGARGQILTADTA
ncbi:hypothetical protein EYF80_055014 [Liparis tanakae]|uniref:Uncharacterized protein n=1 Tax=Liparis tanakae TaxID=230148 RepID=A0A4Z2F0U4_9TELE|nr:hypothetical protein EYF80_055014 [Liparis tanakae]